MKRTLNIAFKDIRQILRDRLALLFLLIMPAAFTLLFSFALGGQADSAAQAARVGFLDLDGSPQSSQLQSLLESSPALRLEMLADGAALEEQLANHSLEAALQVPAGFGAACSAPQALRPALFGEPNPAAAQAIQSAALHLASACQAARLAGGTDGPAFQAALAAALAAWQKPALGLALTSAAQPQPAGSGGGGGMMGPAQSSPGMMLQFAIAGLLTAAQMLVHERKTRCLQRLLTTPAARAEILLGHFLAIFTVSLGQFLILIAFGQVVLKLNYAAQPLATLGMALASALFIAALGLLVGALAKTDEQAILIALVLMFVFAGLGGAWVPLESTGPAFQAVGRLTPVAWAMDGFKAILGGGGLQAILQPAAILLGYAALFFALASAKFRFE